MPRMAFDRRSLLVTGAALAAAAACTDDAPKPAAPPPPASALDVLAAVAFRLLPSDDLGPGAKEAGVDAYLARALQDPRLGHVKPMLEKGAAFLDRAAREEKQQPFVALDGAAQDDLVGRLANGKMRPNDFQGPLFVRFVLALTLEGFLGDPKHGGNKGEVAWKWLGFSPHGRAALHGIGK
jgi:gluconate 2-dehydrogenase gamma chain